MSGVTAQIRYAADIRPPRNQNDDRGVLEDSSQNDQPAAQGPLAQKAGTADPKIRAAASNSLSDVNAGTTLPESYVEPRVAIEPLRSSQQTETAASI
jgi:hypothetical protein